jgi:hypothetical protein
MRSRAGRAGTSGNGEITMKMVRVALAAALIGGLSLSALSLQAAASPYHLDRLPNGQLTGPLSPHANGG